jgi:hypothetical protein
MLNVAKNRDIDFIACWDEIHSSNMSKVCRSQQEFDETEAHYLQQGIKLMQVEKGAFIIAKCAEDVVLENKSIKQGKVLKSVYYRPADLSTLV